MIQNGKKLPNVQRIIGILSGKGGVGKSCVTASLAHSLPGRIGILDADIYGPSIPRILNLKGEPQVDERNRMIPMRNYGIECISMGFLTEKAVVWRGLMVMKALQDLIWRTRWSNLDYLLIDFPPGTGDAQLTIMQQLKLDGCVVVSTPQKISIIDAEKGVQMLEKVEIPLLGIVKNMSSYVCPSCNNVHRLFPDKDSSFWARSNFVAELPFDPRICENMDQGLPLMENLDDSLFTAGIKNMSNHIVGALK